jgi:molecular chaperone Hsp33
MRVELSDGLPARAVGVIAQKLPDSTGDASTEKFVEVLERFNDGRVHESLRASGGVLDVGSTLGVADLVVVGTGPLSFACRCSRERVNAVLALLPRTDLEEMLAEAEPQTVVCHFCGETYRVGRDEIARLLEARGKDV